MFGSMHVIGALVALALLSASCDGQSSNVGNPREERSPTRSAGRPAKGWFARACELPVDQVRRVRRGLFPGRSPEVVLVPKAPNYVGTVSYTTHSGPWDFVQEVPLVLYGPGFIRSRGSISLDREVSVADLAPTLAELLDVELPESVRGQPVAEALLPSEERSGRPRFVLVLVWDGGGTNVLEEWPDSWPTLRTVIEGGTSVTGATVGSSPSVTPAIHATIGTGSFPRQHGIVDIPIRRGDLLIPAYDSLSPRYLRVPTLGDVFDVATGNRAEVGMLAERDWHLGMVGHGSQAADGDRDVAVITGGDGDLITNPDYYSLPQYLHGIPLLDEREVQEADLEDGKQDSAWMGHPIAGPNSVMLMRNPASVDYQTRLLKAIFTREGYGMDEIPDLFFTNYKQPDLIGHSWNMVNPEMQSILGFVDDALAELVRFLDRRVGRQRWVLALTADHGQTPSPSVTKAWPIGITELQVDIAARFELDPEELFQGRRVSGFWLHPDAIDRGIKPAHVARELQGYTLGENIPDDKSIPAGYEDRLDEPLLDAAFPAESTARVLKCALKRS
jgi:hypothetical protein